MEFSILYADKIRVFNGEELFLSADIKNRVKLNLRFYKDNDFILETNFFGFLFFKSVKVKSQSLPYPIESTKQKGIFGFIMEYNDHLIYTVQKPLNQPSYTLFLNGSKMGEIFDSKDIRVGRKYLMKTDTENHTINLYLLLAFLIQLSPLP